MRELLRIPKDEFETFAAEHAEAAIEHRLANVPLGNIAAGAGGRILERYVSRTAARKNYLVCSVYVIDLDGPTHDKEHWRFLGIAGHFLEIERPPSLDE